MKDGGLLRSVEGDGTSGVRRAEISQSFANPAERDHGWDERPERARPRVRNQGTRMARRCDGRFFTEALEILVTRTDPGNRRTSLSGLSVWMENGGEASSEQQEAAVPTWRPDSSESLNEYD